MAAGTWASCLGQAAWAEGTCRRESSSYYARVITPVSITRRGLSAIRFPCYAGHCRQAAYRPRDVAKQCVPVRTSDQLEQQVTTRFGTFVQVSGLGCIDLGDRRSGVQISPARQQESQVRHRVEPRSRQPVGRRVRWPSPRATG